MLQETPPGRGYIYEKRLRFFCPHCNTASTLSQVALPNKEVVVVRKPQEVVAAYACDSCNSAIPILWKRVAADGNAVIAEFAEEVLRVREPFEFAYVPEAVKAPIGEALDCLSVRAYNGFAAMCRRAIQAACEALGADGSTKVEAQIREVKELGALDNETFPAVRQIMLGGHDGAHPQLPSVDQDRAELLLRLLRDVIHELFTRPGVIREAAQKRAEAIKKQRPA